jgi:hypothetical protein
MLNIGLYYQGTVTIANQPENIENKMTNALLKKGWRGYKNYIGSKILYPGYSAKMRQIVMDSKRGNCH